MRIRTGACAAVLVAPLLTGATAQGETVPTPTSDQLDRSVSTFRLEGSVTTYRLERSVRSVESERQEAGETVVSLASDILFAFGSAELPPQGTTRIGELVVPIAQGAQVSVTGHTDSIGDPARNVTLSQQRAQAVAAAVAAARPDLQLLVEGRGDTEPVAPNRRGGKDDPEGRALNRRVEIRFAG